jgi:hypothetical protein
VQPAIDIYYYGSGAGDKRQGKWQAHKLEREKEKAEAKNK